MSVKRGLIGVYHHAIAEQMPEGTLKHDTNKFLAIVSFVVMVLIFVLQANGVEIPWGWSLIVYLVLLGAFVWAFLRWEVPSKWRWPFRYGLLFVAVGVVATLSALGVTKEYLKDNPEPSLLIAPPAPPSVPENWYIQPAKSVPTGNLRSSAGTMRSRGNGPNSPNVQSGDITQTTNAPCSGNSVIGNVDNSNCNPGGPVTTYTWQGWKVIRGPGFANSIGPVDRGGWADINDFMLANRYQDAADLCKKERTKYPEWVAPWIIGADAESNLGNLAEAKRLIDYITPRLIESDTQTCPEACSGILASVKQKIKQN